MTLDIHGDPLVALITSIHAAHAWEALAWDRHCAERKADIATHGVDMVRADAELYMSWGQGEDRLAAMDPRPLWHERVREARRALGDGATERDVREVAVRLDWRLPPHGAMTPMTVAEWVAVRGLEASWLYRKGMSDEGLEAFITKSPERFYPGLISAEELVTLVRANYSDALAKAAGAPFLPVDATTWELCSDRLSSQSSKGFWPSPEENQHFDLLVRAGVDVALLREERIAAEPAYVHVPWCERFAQALAEMGGAATERAVNQRAVELEHAARSAPEPLPWLECLERAQVALGAQATHRALHEYAERLRRGLTPHAGDTLDRDAWLRRQIHYLMQLRFRFDFLLNDLESFASSLAGHCYLDTPRGELKTALLEGYAAARTEEEAEYTAKQQKEHEARTVATAELEALLSAPNASPIEAFHRAACDYRKSGVWLADWQRSLSPR